MSYNYRLWLQSIYTNILNLFKITADRIGTIASTDTIKLNEMIIFVFLIFDVLYFFHRVRSQSE